MASAGNIRAGGAFVEIFAKDGAFQQAMTRVQNRLRQAGKNLQQFGTGLALGAGAVGAPMLLALRQFTQYDDAIRAARAVTGSLGEAGEAAFGRMNDKARELGATTSFTATQVANLMTELGRAGFSPDEINEMTLAVLDLARATGTDATLSAGIMAATLRQFGMGAGEATRVADVLTLAANKTFNNVEMLGEAMKYAGPVAADLGMSLEDTAAILGTLGNVGIQGSMAGTTLRRLGVITAAEGDKLQQIFGVAFKDAAGNARPLVDVLGEVAQATNNLPTAERAKKFSDAFGLLGITGASAIGKVAADTRQLKQDLVNATGTARQTAKEMDAGLGGSMRILLSATEGVALAFGDAIAPAAQALAFSATVAANAIRSLVAQFPIVSQLAAGVVAGFFGLGVAAIAGGFALKVMAGGVAVLSKVVAALATTTGLATLAIVGGIAAILVAAYQLSPAFKTEADAILTALGRLDFKAAWEVMNLNLAIALTQMAQMFENAWAAVKNTVAATAAFIGDKLTEGLDRFMSLFGADILTLQAGLEKLGLYFKAAFDWTFAVNGLRAALKEVDDRVARERGQAPTADARAEQRAMDRQDEADTRQAADDARNAGYEQTIKTLRDDLSRARDRANGVTPAAAESGQPQKAGVSGPAGQLPPPAALPPAPAQETEASSTVGTFSGDLGGRLALGPSLTVAERTASAAERTADGVDALVAAQNGLGNPDGVGNVDGLGNPLGVANEAGALGGGLGAAAAAPFDPGIVNRAAAAAMPAAAQLPVAGDKELLTVAERQASLAAQMVEHLRKLVEHAERGGLAFA
jgi:TP901 family phage tail tape measure protein